MKRLTLALALLCVGGGIDVNAQAEEVSLNTASLTTQPTTVEVTPAPINQPYNGWGYLVQRLRALGVPDQDLDAVYQDPRMPPFTFIPFRLRPKETSAMYTGFATPAQFSMGADFARQHTRQFDSIEKTLHVPREVITAIILVESQLGKNTGKSLVIERLSRVASVGEPENLRKNLELMRLDDPSVEMAEVEARARYLEKTFTPEIPTLIEISKRNKFDVLDLRGSIAGAFGLPQFLPSAFLRFGVDGDRNGRISLYDDVDAIWSAAKYLATFGYRDDIPLKEKRAILWRYNKSDAYIDTILAVSRGVKARLKVPPVRRVSTH